MTDGGDNAPQPPPRPQREDFARDPARLAAIREAIQERAHSRPVPSAADLARRRSLLDAAKWVLPGLALLLLGSIAVWPELSRLMNENRAALREMARTKVESGNMEGAVYRGVDTHGRPYMITARLTHQIGPDRVDLTDPEADIFLGASGWADIRADHGVYMQHEQTLNLWGHVVLYRDDGTLMNGTTADLDLKRSVVASDDGVHAEGPFGILDAQGYFLDQHAGILQFTGPQRVIRNDDSADSGSRTPKSNTP